MPASDTANAAARLRLQVNDSAATAHSKVALVGSSPVTPEFSRSESRGKPSFAGEYSRNASSAAGPWSSSVDTDIRRDIRVAIRSPALEGL